MKKILLINPPQDSYNVEPLYGKFRPYPPLGLLALATFLKNKKTNAEVKILDGQICSLEEIIKIISEMSPNIVGISPFLISYENALKIARFSKKVGAKVILGGHYASFLAKEILLRRGPYSSDYCIDYIVRNDGEEALYKIILDIPPEKIPNVCFSLPPNLIMTNKIENFSFDESSIIDRSFVNIESYFKTGRRLNILSKNGCKWRNSGGGCIFCAAMPNEIRLKSPEIFWKEINFLKKKYDVESIFDGRDDFFDDGKWLEKICHLAPNYPDKPKLIIFTRTDRINRVTIPAFEKLNITEVILGLESGDEEMLSAMRKGISLKANKTALKILSQLGIRTVASFVLGAPGENKKSLNNTLNFAKEMRALFTYTGTPFSMISHFLAPLPGSIAFNLLKARLNSKYRDTDILKADNLINDWVKNFCKVDCKEIFAVGQEINLLKTR